jgi:hypothetical protein
MDKESIPDWALTEQDRRSFLPQPPPHFCGHVSRVHSARGLVIYPEGVEMSAGTAPGNPTGKGGGLRGNVHTFSKASRHRFRDFLLKHGTRDGWQVFSCTFTVPGGPWPLEQYKDLWQRWCLWVKNAGWLQVWRAEVQRRGAMHWHCLVSAPCECGQDIETSASSRSYQIRARWFRTLDDVWPLVKYPRSVRLFVGDGERSYAVEGPLSWWPGAGEHAVLVESEQNGREGWFRYLADHASKVKRDQVGENIGRHWGVNGRRHAVHLVGDRYDCGLRVYARFRRAVNRLARPRVEDDRSPFGSRLGFKRRRGECGRSVVFMRAGTRERLLTWASDGAYAVPF